MKLNSFFALHDEVANSSGAWFTPDKMPILLHNHSITLCSTGFLATWGCIMNVQWNQPGEYIILN